MAKTKLAKPSQGEVEARRTDTHPTEAVPLFHAKAAAWLDTEA